MEIINNVLLEVEEAEVYRSIDYKNELNADDDEKVYTMVEAYEEKHDWRYLNPSNASYDDFVIIITDLYENESNSNKLITRFKRIKEENGERVCIVLLGIKSQYVRNVYDLVGMPN